MLTFRFYLDDYRYNIHVLLWRLRSKWWYRKAVFYERRFDGKCLFLLLYHLKDSGLSWISDYYAYHYCLILIIYYRSLWKIVLKPLKNSRSENMPIKTVSRHKKKMQWAVRQLFLTLLSVHVSKEIWVGWNWVQNSSVYDILNAGKRENVTKLTSQFTPQHIAKF